MNSKWKLHCSLLHSVFFLLLKMMSGRHLMLLLSYVHILPSSSFFVHHQHCHVLRVFKWTDFNRTAWNSFTSLLPHSLPLPFHWPKNNFSSSSTFYSSDETIESLVPAVPGVNASSRDKDTKDNNNNTSTNNETNGRSAALERAYVHDVYENCEEPVGSIRPKVAQFLSNLDPGSLVCDVGCGNGRYLTAACNPAIYSIGVDRCYRLAKVARSAGSEVSSINKHSIFPAHDKLIIVQSKWR